MGSIFILAHSIADLPSFFYYNSVYNGILLSHRKYEIWLFATTWIDLENITLSEISQTKKNEDPCGFTSIWELKKTKSNK